MEQSNGAMYQNGEIIQNSISNNITSYIDTALNTSKNPFAGKANEYAESDAVEIKALDKGIWVNWSAEGDAAVKNADGNYFIAANDKQIFYVEQGKRQLRIIEDEASARSVVIELG